MAVLKCEVCGGELEINEDMSIGVCKFCDSTIVIPQNLEKKGNLYNRAIFLRQNNEFDKAVSTYEDILKEDNSDAEAHWGLVLSKYGIEYVSDPRTRERIPTCHRTQAASILSDPDYLAALENFDFEARRVIEMEAKRISEIQARILEISQKEPPYDIFICYKENDEIGNRTVDSTLAQELYFELVKKGYKVFFSKKTLESRLGTEYEPIIYAALNSAKVMIVLGTKVENFNAVWVKNEWSRFLKMSRDTHKTIIPAYRGMSPYELPAELSALQSQDMSKIGFMQDLMDGIERCMRGETREKTEQNETTSSSYGIAPLERLIKNSETYLKLKDFSAAEEVYTAITKEYPEDHRGWWGLIVCKTRDFEDVFLDQSIYNKWFGYVKQLASHKEYTELEQVYLEYTKKVAELEATEEMKIVDMKISSYYKQVQTEWAQIKREDDAITTENLNFKQTMECAEKEISTIQSNIKRSQELKPILRFGGMFVGSIFGICAGYVSCKIGGFTGGSVMLCLCVAGGVAGLLIMGGLGFLLSIIINDIDGQNKELAKKINMRAIHQQKHDKTVSEYNAKIDSLRNKITEIQEKILGCNNYLNLGKERIVTYLYAEKCSTFGVQQSVDNYVVEYRKKVFDIKEKNQEETLTITCPVCGEIYTAIGKEIQDIEGSYLKCKCGNTIEISFK